MLPISQINENIRTGPKNSKEFIQMCEDFHYDICKLFDIANQHDEDIRYNMDLLIVENYFLQNKIYELENSIRTIRNGVNSLDSVNIPRTLSNSFKAENMFNALYDVDKDKIAQIDSLHGIATIKYNSTSKASIIDQNGVVMIPPSLAVNLYESTDGTTYVPVNDPKVMRTFDCNNSSCWMHKSQYSSINELYILLHIKLPLQSINNVYVNSISIKPTPEYSMEISNIQYITPSNNVPRTIPNFAPIINANKALFMFPSTEITELFIFLKQPYYFIEDGVRSFYYGMQEIGVYNYDFKSDESYIVSKFEIKDKYFSIINSPVIQIPDGCPKNVYNLVEHKLFTDPSDISISSTGIPFNQGIGGSYSTVYILTKIKKTDDVTPAISCIDIDYFTI